MTRFEGVWTHPEDSGGGTAPRGCPSFAPGIAPDCHFKKDYQSFAEGKDACIEVVRLQIEELVNQELLEGRKTTYGDQTVRINGKVASVHYYVVVTDKRGSHKGIISAIFRYQDATWLLWQYHDEYVSD